MDVDALFRKPAFTQLEPKQVQVLRQFAQEIPGKSATEVARMYVQLNQKLAEVKPITSTERNAIVEAVREAMPPKDRHKLNSFMKILAR